MVLTKARVEAEPAEPEQTGAEEDERRVVRNVRALLESDATTEHEGEGQGGGTGVDVNRGSTGEVDGTDPEDILQAVRDPAAVGEAAVIGEAEVEDPAGDREVDDGRPDTGEHHPAAELGAVGDGARDEGDRDDGEGRLEGHEGERRVGRALGRFEEAVQAERRTVDSPGEQRSLGTREGDGVAVQNPQDADEAHRAEAQHHHADDALGLDEATVEECQPRRHEKHEGGGDQQERRITLIH
jgi:hypothetical protein